MRGQFNEAVARWRWSVLVGSAYFVCAIVALRFSGDSNNVAAVWPASGVALAALLAYSKGGIARHLVMVGIGSLGANLVCGATVANAAAFTAANVIEPTLGWYLLARWGVDHPSFDRPRDVARFATVCIASAGLSAVLSALLSGKLTPAFLSAWFLSVLLGQLILTPLIVTIHRERKRFRRGAAGHNYRELVGHLLLTLITCFIVFGQSKLPLLFLAVLPVTFATYRLGALGSTFSVFIVAICASVSIDYDVGPFFMIRDNVMSPLLFAQFYLMPLLAAALPLAAARSASQAMIDEVKRQKRYLELASRTARIGHFRLETDRGEMFWSAEMFRIHGFDEAEGQPSIDRAMAAYHPEDRGRAARALEDCIIDGDEFEYDARIITPANELRHVNCRGRTEMDETGQIIAILGVFQDVSDRVDIQIQLHEARVIAEGEARQARKLAETDQLTGIANRRKIMADLDVAVACARRDATPLTIAIMDIDHFKTINDRHGHAAGDRVLHAVARSGETVLRTSDAMGRIGGEEFLIILQGADIAAASGIAERIRNRIHRRTTAQADLPSVTVSIGLAGYSGQGCVSELFQAADAALYRAKRDGRNLLRVA